MPTHRKLERNANNNGIRAVIKRFLFYIQQGGAAQRPRFECLGRMTNCHRRIMNFTMESTMGSFFSAPLKLAYILAGPEIEPVRRSLLFKRDC